MKTKIVYVHVRTGRFVSKSHPEAQARVVTTTRMIHVEGKTYRVRWNEDGRPAPTPWTSPPAAAGMQSTAGAGPLFHQSTES